MAFNVCQRPNLYPITFSELRDIVDKIGTILDNLGIQLKNVVYRGYMIIMEQNAGSENHIKEYRNIPVQLSYHY